MSETKPGYFIAFEGIDGSGTTTQVPLSGAYLFEKDKNNIVVLTREPTKHSVYGKELRRRLAGKLLPGEEVIDDPQYWTDLFIKDRIWHLDNIVKPARAAGRQILSDRHKLSTIAYQSLPQKSKTPYSMDELIDRHRGLLRPDLTFFLDVSIEVAFARQEKRGDNPEYFDMRDFQGRLVEQYHHAIRKLSPEEHIVVLDGNKPIAEVQDGIRQELNRLYGYQD